MLPQSTTLCACGCGLPLTPSTRRSRLDRRYLTGHHAIRIPILEKLCACGCGQLRPSRNRYGRPSLYIRGHNKRGTNHSPETLQRISQAVRAANRANPDLRRGKNNSQWAGGRRSRNGYVQIWEPEHPDCDIGGYIFEHRLVMEGLLGRYLLPNEVVHHIDGNKLNNAPENLCLFASNGEHHSFHAQERKRCKLQNN